MKRLFPLLVLIVGLSILLLIVRQCRRDSDVSYQTAPVTRGPITQLVTATGTLNPVVNVQVGSQVSGNIQKLFADFNSKVKAGDVVEERLDPCGPERHTASSFRSRAAASSVSSAEMRMKPSAASCGNVSPVAYEASSSA